MKINQPKEMTITDLIRVLNLVYTQHGDLPIVGGYLMDDTPLKRVIAIDEDGVALEDGGVKPAGIYLSQ